MKKLIIWLLLIVPFVMFGQNKSEDAQLTSDKQVDSWILKISSNPDLRIKMMEAMIEKTISNKVELDKLVNCLIGNSDVRKKMMAFNPASNDTDDLDMDARGMKSDSLTLKNKYNLKPVSR